MDELWKQAILPIPDSSSLHEVKHRLDGREDLEQPKQLVDDLRREHLENVLQQYRGVVMRRITQCVQLIHFKLDDMIVCVLKKPLRHLHLEVPFGHHLASSCALRQVFVVFLLQEFCLRRQKFDDFYDCFASGLLEVIIAGWAGAYELRYSHIGVLLVFLMVGGLDDHGQVAVLFAISDGVRVGIRLSTWSDELVEDFVLFDEFSALLVDDHHSKEFKEHVDGHAVHWQVVLEHVDDFLQDAVLDDLWGLSWIVVANCTQKLNEHILEPRVIVSIDCLGTSIVAALDWGLDDLAEDLLLEKVTRDDCCIICDRMVWASVVQSEPAHQEVRKGHQVILQHLLLHETWLSRPSTD